MSLRAAWWTWSEKPGYRRSDFCIEATLAREPAGAAARLAVLAAEWHRHPIEWFCFLWLIACSLMLAGHTPLFARPTIVLLGFANLLVMGVCFYRAAHGRTTAVAAVLSVLTLADGAGRSRQAAERASPVRLLARGEPLLAVIDLEERHFGSGDYIVSKDEPWTRPAEAPRPPPVVIDVLAARDPAQSEDPPQMKRRRRAPASAKPRKPRAPKKAAPRRSRKKTKAPAAPAVPGEAAAAAPAKRARRAKTATPKRPRRKKTPPTPEAGSA